MRHDALMTGFTPLAVLAAGRFRTVPVKDEAALTRGTAAFALTAPFGVHSGDGRLLPAKPNRGELPVFKQRYVTVPHFNLSLLPGWEPMIAFDSDATGLLMDGRPDRGPSESTEVARQ